LPAVELPDGTSEWRRRGVLHRDGGPALVTDDHQTWYVNGAKTAPPAGTPADRMSEADFVAHWTLLATAIHVGGNALFNGGFHHFDSFDDALKSVVRRLRGRKVRAWGAVEQEAVEKAKSSDLFAYSETWTAIRGAYQAAAGLVEHLDPVEAGSAAYKLRRTLRLIDELRTYPKVWSETAKAAIEHVASAMELRAATPIRQSCLRDGRFRFAFVWRRDGKAYRGEAESLIERVDDEDAPVAMELKTRAGDWFALRQIEGKLFRPVFGPGGWRPCPEAAFGSVAEDGVSWVDSPFWRGPTPVAVQSLDGAPKAALAAECASAGVALAAEAGRIVSVGGVVHVECDEPRLRVFANSDGTSFRHGLGWEIPGRLPVDYLTDMDGRGDPQVAEAFGIGDDGFIAPCEGVSRFPVGASRRASIFLCSLVDDDESKIVSDAVVRAPESDLIDINDVAHCVRIAVFGNGGHHDSLERLLVDGLRRVESSHDQATFEQSLLAFDKIFEEGSLCGKQARTAAVKYLVSALVEMLWQEEDRDHGLEGLSP
jgi:hypothetical protein